VSGELIDPQVEDLVSRALAEDIGLRDVTTEALIDPGRRARATIEQKAPGAIYGLDVAHAVFHRLDPLVQWRPLVAEGEWRKEVPAPVAEVEGDARALLSGERVALNFLGHLSGVTTFTASCVYALRGTAVKILDTRKTTPGLRMLEKRAVAAGGGRNHRMGLWDAVLVKENHAVLAGGIGEATRRALERRPPDCPVEVECRTLADVEEALAAGAQRLLLDNRDAAALGRAVELTAGRAELEASGSITPETLKGIAGAGVQFISIGALTHSAPALDLSMRIEEAA
jgi:nicotinate-nucleotide pyrophosphorylase (carboxylating)